MDLFEFHDTVIKVVVEVTISNLEMEVFEDCSVIHQVETVVNVEVLLLCKDKGVFDQLVEGH